MQQDNSHTPQSDPMFTGESVVLQPDLFSGTATIISEPPDLQNAPFPPLVRSQPLTDQSSLTSCFLPYQQDLKLRGKSDYTVTCFLSDLKMFSDFVGRDTPVGRISKEQLTDWLMKLKFGTPGHTPAPKTMARRVTFLKNFFSWLAREGVLREDPAASLVLERPLPPLPQLLFDDEVQRLLQSASTEPRAHCLIYLVLHAGLKKEEVMALKMEHVDISNPNEPALTVHFAAATGKQHRERRLALPAEFTPVFKAYVAKYHPTGELFVCTDRNLNYILARVVRKARIQKRVTLQLLRDMYAVQQLQQGVPLESLREKLGLSEEAWKESAEKYKKLVASA
jgi:site-specific recombinase XerD